jgi:acyl-CoA synthetase (AMP-forming)/AMP-acid ligase II
MDRAQIRIPGGLRDVATVLDGPLARAPGAEALVGRARRYTYAQLDKAVNAASAALRSLGAGTGDRIAAASANAADLVIAFLATQRLGAIWLGVNKALAAPEKLYQLQDSEACVCLADRTTAAQLAEHRSAAPSLRHVIDIEPADEANEWRALIDAHAGAPRPPGDVDPHAPAAIAYTSGTTGRPKGAVHSQHNMMVVAAAGLAGLRGDQWREPLRIGVYLPLTTVNLLVLDVLTALASGGACICMDRSDAGGVADWIQAESVQAMSSAPATIFDLIHRDDIAPGQLASLRFVACGGAMISDELMAGFARKFERPMYPAYGLTEAPSSVAGHMPGRSCALGSCGLPFGHLKLAVLDPDLREVPSGEVGELCVRATQAGAWTGVYTPMLGYWNRTVDTEEALRGGWLHTGDAAAMDGAGNIFLKDRLKELIIRGGANVYPAEIERVLRLDARVRDAAVTGAPDERLGERVVAYVELAPDIAADDGLQEDLRRLCQRELARYKTPDVWKFVGEMPRNAMNKIVKEKLRGV